MVFIHIKYHFWAVPQCLNTIPQGQKPYNLFCEYFYIFNLWIYSVWSVWISSYPLNMHWINAVRLWTAVWHSLRDQIIGHNDAARSLSGKFFLIIQAFTILLFNKLVYTNHVNRISLPWAICGSFHNLKTIRFRRSLCQCLWMQLMWVFHCSFAGALNQPAKRKQARRPDLPKQTGNKQFSRIPFRYDSSDVKPERVNESKIYEPHSVNT